MEKLVETRHKKYLTMKEAADYLGYSYDYFQQIWPSFEKFGVQAFRLGGRKILFKEEQLAGMVEAHAIN